MCLQLSLIINFTLNLPHFLFQNIIQETYHKHNSQSPDLFYTKFSVENILLIELGIHVSTGVIATEILHNYLVMYFNNTNIRNMNLFCINPISTVKNKILFYH